MLLLALILGLVLPLSMTLDISRPGMIHGTTSHYAKVGGHVYHYFRSLPNNAREPRDTILLFHGYPDLAYGWRNQIPYLTSLGYQEIAPDMLGYGEIESPAETAEWAKKKLSGDMARLLDQIVPGQQVILGGRDWGAVFAYRFAVWYPELVKAMFTLVVPYDPALGSGISDQQYVDLYDVVRNGGQAVENITYQLQFRDFGFERSLKEKEKVEGFLNACYDGVYTNGQRGFTGKAVDMDRLEDVQQTPLMNATELEFYVEQFSKNGFRGPQNWYRTARMDWEDERELVGRFEKFEMKALFIGAERNPSLPPATWAGMNEWFEDLTIESVDSGHWVQREKAEEVNEILGTWLGGLDAWRFKAHGRFTGATRSKARFDF